jgi:hypothetical protein
MKDYRDGEQLRIWKDPVGANITASRKSTAETEKGHQKFSKDNRAEIRTEFY